MNLRKLSVDDNDAVRGLLRGRAAFLALVGTLLVGACGDSDGACPVPPESFYRIEWREVPSDCRPAKLATHVYLACARIDEATCNLVLEYGCSVAEIPGGSVRLYGTELRPSGADRFEGEVRVHIEDDDTPVGLDRSCAGPATVALVYDPEWHHASPGPKPRGTCYVNCSTGGVCLYPEGAPHDGYGQCLPTPQPGDRCGITVKPLRGDSPFCEWGSFCNDQNICQRHPVLGEPCKYGWNYCPSEPCYHCDTAPCCDGICDENAPGGPVCVPDPEM